MKKLILVMGVALIALASCNKEADDIQKSTTLSPTTIKAGEVVQTWSQFIPSYTTTVLSGSLTFPSMYKIYISTSGGGKITYKMTGGVKYRLKYTQINASKVAIPNSGTPPQLRQTAGGSIIVNGNTVSANYTYEFTATEASFNGGGENNSWVEVTGLVFERCIENRWEVFTPSVVKTELKPSVSFPNNFEIFINTTGGGGSIKYIMAGGLKYRFTYSAIVASKVAVPNSGTPPQLIQTAGGNVFVAGVAVNPNSPYEFNGSDVIFNGGGQANGWVNIQGAVFERLK